MPIRHYTPTDLPALYAINQASTPGVGHEGSAEGLKRWIDLATCLVATDADGAPLGFINLIEPGTLAYESAICAGSKRGRQSKTVTCSMSTGSPYPRPRADRALANASMRPPSISPAAANGSARK